MELAHDFEKKNFRIKNGTFTCSFFDLLQVSFQIIPGLLTQSLSFPIGKRAIGQG
jgi:hypothetical protein